MPVCPSLMIPEQSVLPCQGIPEHNMYGYGKDNKIKWNPAKYSSVVAGLGKPPPERMERMNEHKHEMLRKLGKQYHNLTHYYITMSSAIFQLASNSEAETLPSETANGATEVHFSIDP